MASSFVYLAGCKGLRFDMARDRSIEPMHLMKKIRRLVSKHSQWKYLQDGVTLEETDYAVENLIFLLSFL